MNIRVDEGVYGELFVVLQAQENAVQRRGNLFVKIRSLVLRGCNQLLRDIKSVGEFSRTRIHLLEGGGVEWTAWNIYKDRAITDAGEEDIQIIIQRVSVFGGVNRSKYRILKDIPYSDGADVVHRDKC